MNLTFIILGCIVPGLMTGVGAIPIFFAKDVSQKALDVLLAAAAGVMLAATCFSLIIPSLEVGEGRLGVIVTGLGIFCGALMLDLIDRYAPHEHLIDKKHEGVNVKNLSKIWLFVIAIAIHNFPEGLATGVGFGGDNMSNGLSVAFGIALQNMPEGLAVAFADKINDLMIDGYSNITFIIGGSLGLSDEVLKRADYKLSFSKMTFPHKLMRVILMEQIYRAFRIINNHPYHK